MRIKANIKKANQHKITSKEIDKVAHKNLEKSIKMGTIDELTMAKEMRKLSNSYIVNLNMWTDTNDDK